MISLFPTAFNSFDIDNMVAQTASYHFSPDSLPFIIALDAIYPPRLTHLTGFITFLNSTFDAFFVSLLALNHLSRLIKEMDLLIKETDLLIFDNRNVSLKAKISQLRHFKGGLRSQVFS